MKRNSLNLFLTLAALAVPMASAMNYQAPAVLQRVLPSAPALFENYSGCSASSHTVAVGYDVFLSGFRMICADAGDIGFWTTPVNSVLAGDISTLQFHFLCPSGMALAGGSYIEGIRFPFALCAPLIPQFSTGTVVRGNVVTPNGDPVTWPTQNCGPSQFVQTLQASRDAAGNVTGMGMICNSIQTINLIHPTKQMSGVDLAVRTVGQTPELGENSGQSFELDVYNLGFAPVHAANVTLEIRFNTFAWDLVPAPGMVCSDIMVRKGPVDMFSLGKRCTLPGLGLKAEGGENSVNLTLQPQGGAALRPPTPTPQPIVSIKAIVRDESIDGADGDLANDVAAFPVQIL